ncbi:hypothetical protein Q2T41_19210 [Maribacter confluentis]|uniref:Uncharacterized protein n=1 Tax=Maribacter confluentis TaxID=1656093 RepID=A0ABT8RVT7_9FLAO|nr:hypothetical protein [Maribacter confluentis]MDO1514783.1 hypothetical protein [Maribacter confluentis]
MVRQVWKGKHGDQDERLRSANGATAVIPQPGTNYLEIADAFYEEYEKLKKDLPEGFKLNVVMMIRSL